VDIYDESATGQPGLEEGRNHQIRVQDQQDPPLGTPGKAESVQEPPGQALRALSRAGFGACRRVLGLAQGEYFDAEPPREHRCDLAMQARVSQVVPGGQ
jgi:hypothetical protein